MAVRPEEITAILKEQIEQFGADTAAVNVGTVIEAGDGIARVHGLSECMYSELVEFENGVIGPRDEPGRGDRRCPRPR